MLNLQEKLGNKNRESMWTVIQDDVVVAIIKCQGGWASNAFERHLIGRGGEGDVTGVVYLKDDAYPEKFVISIKIRRS